MNSIFVINSYSAIEYTHNVQRLAFEEYEKAEEYLLKFCNHDKEISIDEDGILRVYDQYKHKDMDEYYIIKDLRLIK